MERFADIEILRYRLRGFDELSARQRVYIYYLSQATLFGRDITFSQFGRHNLFIRTVLETVFTTTALPHEGASFEALEEYLKRVWFSSGIHHHYGMEKFVPLFSEDYFREALHASDTQRITSLLHCTLEDVEKVFSEVVFDPDTYRKRVNKADGEDLIATSACNFYDGLSQREAEDFYARMTGKPSWGLNSQLVKQPDGTIVERVWTTEGMYGPALRQIVYWLRKAGEVAENETQKDIIATLVKYYETGDLRLFDDYSIKWLQDLDGQIDFINGFIEVYGDPLGLKGSWEGLVEYVDREATRRTETISGDAQWFEDHSPVDPRFKKKEVRGVSARVICAAMLGGDEYPSTAIGINLPNADWIRAEYGSKSITISNITEAYNQAALGSGMREEFVIDQATRDLMARYGDLTDDLHTDLHECLGHGSGQLLEGVSPDALKAYGNTIEEARADLFALYYLADHHLVELGLLPDDEAYKAAYYGYMMNGLLTQLVRIRPGHQIEEAHMRNRALIARWCLAERSAMRLVEREGKTFLEITDYAALRGLVARLLAEVQRIKSEGDFEAARQLVEKYAVAVEPDLHAELLSRYECLHLAPYKGFLNPLLTPVLNEAGEVVDVSVSYDETYTEQMLRYSRDYATLVGAEN